MNKTRTTLEPGNRPVSPPHPERNWNYSLAGSRPDFPRIHPAPPYRVQADSRRHVDAWYALNTTALRRYFETFDPATSFAIWRQTSMLLGPRAETAKQRPGRGSRVEYRMFGESNSREELGEHGHRFALRKCGKQTCDRRTTSPGAFEQLRGSA